MFIVTPVLKIFGLNESDVAISRMTFERNRQFRRKKLLYDIRNSFKAPQTL